MHVARQLLTARNVAVLICAAALLLKLLVPTGYMIARGGDGIAITICSGVEPRTVTMNMPGMHDDMPDHGKSKEHGGAEMPCAFSGLSAAALGSTDPLQLAALIAFVTAMGIFGSALPTPSARPYLRPPLRGPPADF